MVVEDDRRQADTTTIPFELTTYRQNVQLSTSLGKKKQRSTMNQTNGIDHNKNSQRVSQVRSRESATQSFHGKKMKGEKIQTRFRQAIDNHLIPITVCPIFAFHSSQRRDEDCIDPISILLNPIGA